MNDIQNIPKSLELTAGADFAFLRGEGLELIQQLAGKHWSDHNLHDPGITLLEAFCYSLTELSLKANLDIKDLLVSSEANAEQTLFKAEEVLNNRPTTVRDYRKILIDTEGVRNGWIIPLSPSAANDTKGWYDILLELEDDSELGDINSGILQRSFSIDFGGGDIRDYTIEVSFPYWDEEEVLALQEAVIINNVVSSGAGSVMLNTINSPEDRNDYFTELVVSHDGDSPTTFGVTIRVSPPIGADPAENTAVETEIINLLSEVPGGGPGDQSILTTFNRKVVAAAAIEAQVLENLQAHRNLCEDIQAIKAVRIQEISLDVHIELLLPLNVEEYLAQLIFALELFFKPEIRFSTLQELLNQGLSVEDIFEGPLLSNGFLSDAQLDDLPRSDGSDRNSRVYVSDLVNLLIRIALQHANVPASAIEGQGIAISSISISNFIRNKLVVAKATDCLVLAKPELFKPRFSLNKSNIRFTRNGLPLTYNLDLVETLYQALKTSNAVEEPIAVETTSPSGQVLPIGSFYSIQHDFPAVYGLSKHVLPDSFPSDQRAKVEQFRAYLVLVDQLLGSFTSQLRHLNDLFSISPGLTNTYFKQTLYQIPYLNRLLVAFLNSAMDWEAFQADMDNDYQSALADVYESTSVFLDRRNRFLDHLLGRFGHSLSRFISWRYEEEAGGVANPTELNLRQQEIAYELMLDKINILKLFPLLSGHRFAAHNYRGVPWETDNISGLARRLLTFLGIFQMNRRSFYNEAPDFINVVSPVAGVFNYQIVDENNEIVLEGTSSFPNEVEAETAALEVIQQGVYRNHFHIQEQLIGPDTRYVAGFQSDTSLLPALLASYPELQEQEFAARILIRQIMRHIRSIAAGVFIVEHILLRPDLHETDTLNIPNPNTDTFLSDPYSMRVTIVFPSGYDRDFSVDDSPLIPAIPAWFRDEKLRTYIADLVGQETPAHIIPHLFWLHRNTAADASDTPSINNFTERWQAWLEAKASSAANLGDRRTELLEVLNALYAMQSD